MTATALIDHIKQASGAVEREEVTPQGQIALHTTPEKWHVLAQHLRECARCNFGMFNWLSAVDMEDQGFEVVAHLYSAAGMIAVNMKTMVPRDGGSVPTLTDLWRGAAFHERECWEMFGIDFAGHPHLVKLLLAEPFEGHPLRKEFLLMTREAKEWPGAKEPE